MGKNKIYSANRNGYRCNTQHCAKYANDQLRAAGYSYVGGDAWSRRGSTVYNGYKNTDLNKDTTAGRLQHGIDAAKDIYKNFNSNTLDKNKIYQVNMFYRGSPYIDKAYEDADGNGIRGTHTGNLYWDNNTGSWRVEHNIHGTVHNEDWIALQKRGASGGQYGPTAIQNVSSNWLSALFGFKFGGKLNYLQYQKMLNGGQINKYAIGGISFKSATIDKTKYGNTDDFYEQSQSTKKGQKEDIDTGWEDIIDGDYDVTSNSSKSQKNGKVSNFSGDNADFVKELSDAYSSAGITNPEVQKVLIGQDALETGWGKHMAGNYNYGNITAGSSWKGNTTVRKDNQNGKNYTFRSYNSTQEYIQDKIRLLTKNYDITNNDSAEQVIAKLNGQNHNNYKYAEASHYKPALQKMYSSVGNYFA